MKKLIRALAVAITFAAVFFSFPENAFARTYFPTHGRFNRPDPLGTPSGQYPHVHGKYFRPTPVVLPDGPNVYTYVRNNPVNHTDPLGLACCCKKIIIKDSPKNAGIGGITLGAIVGKKFSYGFHVRVEAKVTNGDDISKCKIDQYLFMLMIPYDKNIIRIPDKSNLTDDTRHIKDVSDTVADTALVSWTKNKEEFHHDMNNSRFFPGEWWNDHGDDWLEYADPPGHGTGIPANFHYWQQYLTVKVFCKGTDNKMIVARFFLAHTAKKDKTGTWQSSLSPKPSPDLGTGHTWDQLQDDP